MTEDLVKRLREGDEFERFMLAERAADRIDELETKLAKSEARSEILETLIMDVADDLYDGVPDYKIDQRIGDVMRQLDEEEEED
jgi:hypothetical protein